jgi:DNA replication and repair protein RecF
VHIETVELTDFRSYQSLLFNPVPNLNILTGPNAQGKTNLLEGIALLTVGRSFRGAKPLEMARWGARSAAVSGEIRRNDASRRLRRILAPRDDGVWVLMGEGCPWARAIPFGWADLAIVNGAPQARRNFLDGFVAKIYPAYATTHRRYRQVLARRNHLLQTSGGSHGRLEPWNEQIVDLGIEIVSRRRQGVVALSAEAERLYPALGGRGSIAIEYRSALGDAPTTVSFHELLCARLPDEIRRGQTLVGPHRDDLFVALQGRDLRTFGSRGQQRLMALTLRLAEAAPVEEAVGSAPVILLDDALSELDPGVQGRVLSHVSRVGQVFLTTADAPLTNAAEAHWWEVRDGAVRDASYAALRGAA